jgi:hypothetical protein
MQSYILFFTIRELRLHSSDILQKREKRDQAKKIKVSNKKANFSFFPFQGLAGANTVLQCTQSKLVNTLTHKQTPKNNIHPRAPSITDGAIL